MIEQANKDDSLKGSLQESRQHHKAVCVPVGLLESSHHRRREWKCYTGIFKELAAIAVG